VSGPRSKNPVLWSHLTRDELAAQAPGATLLLPLAATEQHGPHLPAGTDALITEAVALRVATALAGRVAVVVAPTLPVGFSAHHQAFCGVLTLSAPTMAAVLRELGAAAVRSRFRRLFFLNGHGGNDELIRVAARELVAAAPPAPAADGGTRQRRPVPLRVGACSYWAVAEAALRREAALADEVPVPGHAGLFETALLLALWPELVRRDRFPLGAVGGLHPTRPGVFAQAAGEWARSGGFTDAPLQASAELGERLLGVIVREVAEAVATFHEVD
jgi:creatinine amidohydrolase